MKNELPIPALAISYLGAITTILTEAKSLIGALAALASLTASICAITLTRERIKRVRKQNCVRRSRTSFAKRIRRLLAHCFLFVAFAVVFTGCASIGPNGNPSPVARIASFPARVLDAAATLVTETTTNIVEHAVVTATDVVTLNPATQAPVTNTTYSTNLTLVTNITALPKSVIVKTIDTAQTATSFLPPPYGEAAAGAFALISALLAGAVRRRDTMLKTVIHGVETSGSKEAKSQIADHALENGVLPELHALVKKLTQ